MADLNTNGTLAANGDIDMKEELPTEVRPSSLRAKSITTYL